MPFHGLQGRVHKAVLWRRIGTDSTGQPVVSNIAEQLDVRWDDTRREVLGKDGTPTAIDATASGLDREVPEGSAMWKGKIEDMPGTGQVPILDVMRVVTCTPTDDIRGRSTYREVTLMRDKNVLGQTGAPI